MSENVIRKACGCVGATASGPRVVEVARPVGEAGGKIVWELVDKACDRCNRPLAAERGR